MKHIIIMNPVKTFLLILVVTFFFLMPSAINAQRANGDVGIGAQIGQPTGLTIKLYKESSSLDFLAAWDWDKFFFLNVHNVWDTHLNSSETIHLFYGPGAYIGIRDREPQVDDIAIGISATIGLDLILGKLEFFIQATPRLELIKATNFDLGGGGGFRVYF